MHFKELTGINRVNKKHKGTCECCTRVHMNVVPRSTGNTKSGTEN